jgi:hypothetical protein
MRPHHDWEERAIHPLLADEVPAALNILRKNIARHNIALTASLLTWKRRASSRKLRNSGRLLSSFIWH